MKRTSLFLDDSLLKELRRTARARGVSVATVVREAVAAYLGGNQATHQLPSIAGAFTSGLSDTSERVEELLWRDPHG